MYFSCYNNAVKRIERLMILQQETSRAVYLHSVFFFGYELSTSCGD